MIAEEPVARSERLGSLRVSAVVVASFLWLAFQLWVASPLPYVLGVGILNLTEIRSLHLGFALFVVFLTLSGPPWLGRGIDMILGAAAALAATYLFLAYDSLADHPGRLAVQDVLVSIAGVLLLLEAMRRTFGLFVGAVFALLAALMLSGIAAEATTPASSRLFDVWLTTEAVFGSHLGVSAGYLFLFVALGAIADHYELGASLWRWIQKHSGPRTGLGPEARLPSAFDGHLGKWIMLALGFWQLQFYGEAPQDHIVTQGICLLVIALFVGLLGFAGRRMRGAARDPGRGLGQLGSAALWVALLLGCLGVGLLLFMASGIVMLPLTIWPGPREDLFGEVVVPMIALLAFVGLLSTVRGRADQAFDRFAGLLALSLSWLILSWFLFVEQRSAGFSAFWAVAAGLVMVLSTPGLRAVSCRKDRVRGQRALAGLSDLRAIAVQTAAAMAYVAVFCAAWGCVDYFLRTTPLLRGLAIGMLDGAVTFGRGSALPG